MRHRPVPIEQWGRDHWSTFAYLMACVTTKAGRIDHRRMRCDRQLHPGLAHEASLYGGPCPPTRLKGDKQKRKHDDWDCLDDIVAAGLLTHVGTGIHPGIVQALPPAWPIAKWIWKVEAEGGRWSAVDLEAARAFGEESSSPIHVIDAAKRLGGDGRIK